MRPAEVCFGRLSKRKILSMKAQGIPALTGQEINLALGRAMREFQNAARAELEVSGPEWPWVESQSTEPSESVK